MRRSDFVIRVATGLFFAAVAAYLGFYLMQAIDNPFQTVTAISYTVYDSTKVTGIIIRDEQVLKSDYEIVYVTAGEGKKIASSGEVAIAYENREDMEREVERRSLITQIERLNSIKDGATELADPIKLDAQIKKDVLTLKRAVLERDMGKVRDMSDSLLTLAYSGSFEQGDISQLSGSLNSRLSELGPVRVSGSTALYAPVSGTFSRAVDGFEDVKPEMLQNLNVQSLSELIADKRKAAERAVGKMVFGTKWYYAANVPAADARMFRPGDPDFELEIIFGKYYNEKLIMKVESVGLEENGVCPVVFSCDHAMADTLTMRIQNAEIIKLEHNGIRVPKKAIHLTEEGEPCVFVVTGLQAEMKLVEIIYETSDYYMVENNLQVEDSLRIGDIIIVSAKNLYDGKVIKS